MSKILLLTVLIDTLIVKDLPQIYDKSISMLNYSPVNSVSFHPEGQLIVIGCWDSTLKIYDVFHKTRKAVSSLKNTTLSVLV